MSTAKAYSFQNPPWQLPGATVEGLPAGMLRSREASMLYHLARDYFSGMGDIIDAGAFLGASSFCLAKGLQDNQSIGATSGRIHAYDF